MKWFARAGYAARGLIYLFVGILAILAAAGAARPAGARDALSLFLSHWSGSALSYALAFGLLLYGCWRLTQALLDADGHGTDVKALTVRAALLVSGTTYLTLALYAVSLRRGASGNGGGVAEALAGFVGARWTAALLALALAGAGVAHLLKAARRGYAKWLETTGRELRFVDPVARAGLGARGAVLLVLALLLALRAWRGGGPGSAGSREALQFIQQMPAGGRLLAATGLGLISFAGGCPDGC